MAIQTALTRRLKLTHPIIQAPLAGGGDTPALVAAVGEAGALGFIGAAYLTPPQIAESARAVRGLTQRPFGINLFAPMPRRRCPRTCAPRSRASHPTSPSSGCRHPRRRRRPADAFPALFEAALESGASAFSFTFGVLPAAAIAAIKARGMFLMGTATTVEEAAALEQAGVDAVVAQGSRGGRSSRHVRGRAPTRGWWARSRSCRRWSTP